jgi:undecaprenyl pyrophosphate synthase
VSCEDVDAWRFSSLIRVSVFALIEVVEQHLKEIFNHQQAAGKVSFDIEIVSAITYGQRHEK